MFWPYFTHKVSAKIFLIQSHPAIFEHAASLSIAPKKVVIIEDSNNGIKAKAAGILCIGYNSFHSEAQDLSAGYHSNHFNELNYKLCKN
jgi:beta-phosphoglucomutase-like phosphatase (HAD superfamily)